MINNRHKSGPSALCLVGLGWVYGCFIQVTSNTKNSKNMNKIKFCQFIPKHNLNKYQLSATARRANYEMFHYGNMDTLPFFLVYEK